LGEPVADGRQVLQRGRRQQGRQRAGRSSEGGRRREEGEGTMMATFIT
jgi:hypothetical protein